MSDDLEAIRRVLAGDVESFRSLVERYQRPLWSLVRNLTPRDTDHESVAQEVFLAAFRRLAWFDPQRAAFSTWLFTIARNRRIDVIRKERRPELDPEDPMLVPEAPASPDEQLQARDREARVAEAIKMLPPEQAELLRQAFYLAKSHSEIAAEMKLPLGTVKSRLRLAFGRMRKVLEGEEA